MALVSRPQKAAGTTQFQTEFAAGAIGIQDTEVDADFEALYRLVNGNLDTTNLSQTAAISYDQLSLAGRITNTDISPTANISGAKIAPGTIPGTALAPGAIANNSIGLAQLALGAATNFLLVQGLTATSAAPAIMETPGRETFLGGMDWTGRGGFFFVLAALFGVVGADGATPEPGLRGLLWTGGNPGVPDGTIIGGNFITNMTSTAGISFFPVTLLLCQMGRAPAGAARVKVSASSMGRVVGTCEIQDGWLMVAEFA